MAISRSRTSALLSSCRMHDDTTLGNVRKMMTTAKVPRAAKQTKKQQHQASANTADAPLPVQSSAKTRSSSFDFSFGCSFGVSSSSFVASFFSASFFSASTSPSPEARREQSRRGERARSQTRHHHKIIFQAKQRCKRAVCLESYRAGSFRSLVVLVRRPSSLCVLSIVFGWVWFRMCDAVRCDRVCVVMWFWCVSCFRLVLAILSSSEFSVNTLFARFEDI